MKQGWKTCKFADVFDLQMGKTPSRDNPTYWGDDNMWVSIADMNEQKYMSATKEGITDVAVQESGIKPIPKGTVIMSFKLSIGKVSIATSKLYTNEAIMGFIEKEEGTLVPEYLYYYLKGYKWEGANKAAMGMTLNKKTIAENTISYPPVAEQEKIVAELDCLSGIIEKKKQQLKELDNLAQSIFYEMFGDPVENDKGWNVQGFSTACDVITDFVAAGSFADIKKNVQYKESQDYAQLVRTTDLKNKFMKSGFVYISESAFNYLWRVNLNQECIILPNVGVNCGEVYYVNPSMLPYSNNVLGPNAILVRSKKENHRYLSALFTTSYFQCQLKGIVNAVGQPKFNKTELKKLEVILPPLPLQQDFASKIESIEKQKELIAQSIKETETLFNSRMDYYFN